MLLIVQQIRKKTSVRRVAFFSSTSELFNCRAEEGQASHRSLLPNLLHNQKHWCTFISSSIPLSHECSRYVQQLVSKHIPCHALYVSQVSCLHCLVLFPVSLKIALQPTKLSVVKKLTGIRSFMESSKRVIRSGSSVGFIKFCGKLYRIS